MYSFNGEWEFERSFQKFKPYYFDTISNNRDKVHIVIRDKYGDMSPDPQIQQIETIKFLDDPDNQNQIKLSIIQYLKKAVYPYYKENCFTQEEYPSMYLEINNLSEFDDNFYVSIIEIPTTPNLKSRRYKLFLETKLLDSEHGLTIEMDEFECLKHGSGDGEMVLTKEEEKIMQIERSKYHKILDNENPVIYKPNPKYNRLKPWQKDANRRFLVNAYRSMNEKDFLQAVEKENIDLSKKMYLYQKAKEDQKQFIVDYFESKIINTKGKYYKSQTSIMKKIKSIFKFI